IHNLEFIIQFYKYVIADAILRSDVFFYIYVIPRLAQQGVGDPPLNSTPDILIFTGGLPSPLTFVRVG
ncbi:MAG: hypothetical protein II209_01375, partial [Alistipes sp.]|nr:hypothetical protein [Alistipes sp.]